MHIMPQSTYPPALSIFGHRSSIRFVWFAHWTLPFNCWELYGAASWWHTFSTKHQRTYYRNGSVDHLYWHKSSYNHRRYSPWKSNYHPSFIRPYEDCFNALDHKNILTPKQIGKWPYKINPPNINVSITIMEVRGIMAFLLSLPNW